MGRLNPKNREEAFAYQFEDDVRVLFAVAQNGRENDFEKASATQQTMIVVIQLSK